MCSRVAYVPENARPASIDWACHPIETLRDWACRNEFDFKLKSLETLSMTKSGTKIRGNDSPTDALSAPMPLGLNPSMPELDPLDSLPQRRPRKRRRGPLIVGRFALSFSLLRSRSVTTFLLVIVLLASTFGLAWTLTRPYPLEHWLFPRYLKAWSFVCLFHAASLLTGWQVLRLVLPVPPRLHERLVLSHACGVLFFYLGLFLAGIAGAYDSVFFWLLPLSMLAIGTPRFALDFRRMWPRHARHGLRPLLPHTFVETLASLLIVVGLIAVYVQILPPSNICYDARWYHLPIAQHYVAAGGIRRFDEGWFLGTYPQLASLLYTWAHLSPGDFFDHLTLCSHLEYSLLIATFVGLAALVRRFLGYGRHYYAGAALFLFQGLFVYDSSLVTNADHILAFWVAPLTIGLLRLSKRFTTRDAILAGALVGGAICTKYQSCFLLAPVTVYVGYLTLRERRLSPAVIWGLTVAVVTSTHWLKNWVFYHDPLYPMLNQVLPSMPFHANAASQYRHAYWDPYFLPTGRGWAKWMHMVKAMEVYPFTRHTKLPISEATRPVIGALFNLLVPALLFLPSRRRLLTLAAGIYLGIGVWYMTSHQDRYLQTLLPWMAVVVAVSLIQLWKLNLYVRIATSMLVGLQTLVVAGAYFAPEHAMSGNSAIHASVNFLGDSFRHTYEDRLIIDRTTQAIHTALPEHAKVLIHNLRIRFGLNVEAVTDETGWQGAIEYLALDTPRNVASLWQQLGITHLVTRPEGSDANPGSLVRELVYARALQQYTTPFTKRDDWHILKLKLEPKSNELAGSPTRVAWLVCDSPIPLGLYEPSQIELGLPIRKLIVREQRDQWLAELADSNAVVTRRKCDNLKLTDSDLQAQYSRVTERDEYRLWLRK